MRTSNPRVLDTWTLESQISDHCPNIKSSEREVRQRKTRQAPLKTKHQQNWPQASTSKLSSPTSGSGTSIIYPNFESVHLRLHFHFHLHLLSPSLASFTSLSLFLSASEVIRSYQESSEVIKSHQHPTTNTHLSLSKPLRGNKNAMDKDTVLKFLDNFVEHTPLPDIQRGNAHLQAATTFTAVWMLRIPNGREATERIMGVLGPYFDRRAAWSLSS